MFTIHDLYLPLLPDGVGRFGYCPPGLVEGWMEVEHNLLHKTFNLVVIWILDPDLPVVGNRARVVRVSRDLIQINEQFHKSM